MAFNPSPQVKYARDFATKFKKTEVIILSINENLELEYASYGKTKELCADAKKIADIAFDAIIKEFT
uniref:Uncharacterized protein n=1 Tax=viral metagenome TaxID=1070528 RepID=A0A6M3LQK2_9ZZZZ